MLLSEYLESHTQTEVAELTGLTPSAICRAQHRNVFIVPINTGQNGKLMALYELKRIDQNQEQSEIKFSHHSFGKKFVSTIGD